MLPSQLAAALVLAPAFVLLAFHFFTVSPVALVPQSATSSVMHQPSPYPRKPFPEVSASAHSMSRGNLNVKATVGVPELPSSRASAQTDTEQEVGEGAGIEPIDYGIATSPPSAQGEVPALPSVGRTPSEGAPEVDWLVGMDHLPGTVEAQRLLFALQNPPNCSERRFFVVGLRDCGFGGIVHGLSFALARAMHKNRTLLVRPPTKWHFAPKGMSNVGLDYYFEPISSCTLPKPGDKVAQGQYQTIRVSEGSQKYGLIPHQFRGKSLTFWRAQSSRYILRRPRPWYAQHLARVMKDLLPDGVPRPSLCMHVRRSDKRSEAKDTPFAKYMKVADDFRQKDPMLQHIFISTEDDAVINETVRHPNWSFHFCKEDRHNWNHDQVAAIRGGDYLADISFANLYYHMECDYLVITRKSNWCRLIEELRLTGNRSSRPTYNLSPVYAKTWY